MSDEPPVLTPREAGELLRVGVSTVYRMIARGELPAARLPGGGRRIRREDVDRLLEPGATQPARKAVKRGAARERRTSEILEEAGLA